MKRDVQVLKVRAKTTLRDPVREAVGLPLGTDGEYFVGNDTAFGQGDDESVVDHNQPPRTQPGLWCQWVPTKDGLGIEWDGGEKFYDYTEWLKYIIANFLELWGHTLSGSVIWQGEQTGDVGTIVVEDNVVKVLKGVQKKPPVPGQVEPRTMIREDDKCAFCGEEETIVYISKVNRSRNPAKICESCATEVVKAFDEIKGQPF
jgi:hypothetical protein